MTETIADDESNAVQDDDLIADENQDAEKSESESRQEDKLIPASRVTQLVQKAKAKGKQSMAEQLEALQSENEMLRKQSEMQSEPQPSNFENQSSPSTQTQPQTPDIDYDSISEQVMQRLQSQREAEQKAQQEQELEKTAQEVASSFNSKMSDARQSYDDFDELTQDFNAAAFPNLVYLVTQFDNTGPIMYELLKNPQKLATAAYLSEHDPKSAHAHLNRLSGSLQANEQAKAQQQVSPEPLSRLQPSSVSGQKTEDVHNMGVADFKDMFRG